MEPILEALKAVGARHAVLATLRVAAFADSVEDTEKAVAMMEAAIALLAALQGKERETAHTAVVCALLHLRAPAKEELVALGEKLVVADRATSLALRVGALSQCAMMYAVKTPSVGRVRRRRCCWTRRRRRRWWRSARRPLRRRSWD